MSNFKISLLSTGGTIEKIYDEAYGLLENRGPVIKDKIVKKLRLPYTEFEVYPLMSKDSLLMTEDDRTIIVKKIEECLNYKGPVVVLHGTDSMVQTAKLALNNLKNINYPVIFTGAMKPFGFEDSDALQNVTEAFLAARILTPGIYISFHSTIFAADNVEKCHAKGTFRSLTI